ncbi:hypothetical protein [Chelatococcus reniformis]|uniref:hypothetical protein n=1 Tax=Chelatococcus reniformis TaxID=1494448 RepID=UPI00166D340F|nr:hypothetical protein [Chelatococcus reniformis]
MASPYQLGWTPAAIVAVCCAAVEVAVLAVAAAHVRSASRYARSAVTQTTS